MRAAAPKAESAALVKEAESLLSRGLVPQARDAATRACAADPDYPQAFMVRARADLALGRPADARNALSRLPVLKYDGPEGHLLWAETYLAGGHGPEAFGHADRAAALAPKEGKAFLYRALARAAMGEPRERVLEDCAKAGSLSSRCPAPPKAWSGGPGEARPPEGSAAGPYGVGLFIVGTALVLGIFRNTQ